MAEGDTGLPVESPAEVLPFLVIVPEDEGEDYTEGGNKSVRAAVEDVVTAVRDIPVEVLRHNLNSTVTTLNTLFAGVPASPDGFSLTQVEIAFEVTASGQVALLGTGVQATGGRTLTLTFAREGAGPDGTAPSAPRGSASLSAGSGPGLK